MINIQLAGRLGNNLFQLSFARYVSKRYKKNVTIFSDRFHGVENYELERIVSINSSNVGYRNSADLLGLCTVVFEKMNSLNLSFTRTIANILRIQMQLDPYKIDIFKKGVPKLITGYFQEPRLVLEEINILGQEIMNNLRIEKPKNYQAFHIRRGDSLKDNSKIGTLDLQYFQNLRNTELELVVCSDDQDLKEELIELFGNLQFFGPQDMNTIQAFKILASAQELVASNSTFSWWSGVIGNLNGAKVFIPNNWDNTGSIPTNHFVLPGMTSKNSIFVK